MDEKLRRHADTLAAEMVELYGLGFEDDDLRQQCHCLSQRAFARAFPRFRHQPEEHPAHDATKAATGAGAAPLDAALPGEDETPIG